MSDMNDRYKKAAALRLMTAMSPGPVPQQNPGVPNYSAIPLDPPKPRQPMFGDGLANALEWMGFGNRPKPQGPAPSTLPDADLAQRPNIAPGAFAPSTADSDMAVAPPTQGTIAPYFQPPMPSRQGGYGPGPSPAPGNAGPPTGANAAFVPPPGWMPPADYMRTQGDADMGGYGGVPRMQSQQEMYGHLNPTPGLEEIFRREYAANPGAFGKLFG